MEYIVDKNSIVLRDNSGNIFGKVEFEEVEKGVFNIFHTYVDESLRGKGVASKLVKMVKEEIEKRNGKVIAACSYAKKWLEKNI